MRHVGLRWHATDHSTPGSYHLVLFILSTWTVVGQSIVGRKQVWWRAVATTAAATSIVGSSVARTGIGWWVVAAKLWRLSISMRWWWWWLLLRVGHRAGRTVTRPSAVHRAGELRLLQLRRRHLIDLVHLLLLLLMKMMLLLLLLLLLKMRRWMRSSHGNCYERGWVCPMTQSSG